MECILYLYKLENWSSAERPAASCWAQEGKRLRDSPNSVIKVPYALQIQLAVLVGIFYQSFYRNNIQFELPRRTQRSACLILTVSTFIHGRTMEIRRKENRLSLGLD